MSWFRYEPGEDRPGSARPPAALGRVLRPRGRGRFRRSARTSTISTARPETFAGAPPNVVHSFKNSSDATAIFLNIHAPSIGLRRTSSAAAGRAISISSTRPRTAADRSPTRSSSPAGAGRAARARAARPPHLRPSCPSCSAIEMTFHPEFEGVDPHTTTITSTPSTSSPAKPTSVSETSARRRARLVRGRAARRSPRLPPRRTRADALPEPARAARGLPRAPARPRRLTRAG